MCPYCQKDAPIVYRGVLGYCTACGKARPPLVTSSVSLAGQGARVGGVLARSAGWVILALGLIVSSLLFAGLYAVFGGAPITWIIAVLAGGVTALLGGGLVASGKKLSSSGTHAQRFAREKALLALAAHKGGTVTALDASRSLDIPMEEASAFLTDLAKRVPNDVAVDIDDQGGLLFTFVHANVGLPTHGGAPAGQRVRVEPNASRSAPPEPIDAEFTDETAEAEARARR